MLETTPGVLVVERQDRGCFREGIRTMVFNSLVFLVLFAVVYIAYRALPHRGEGGMAVYAFAMQIYCAFSGYSDIAWGVAQMMGGRLIENFRLPYLAKNPKEFWAQWHIGLSTWLRDYVYIPLGGNRKRPRRQMLNLFLTMSLGLSSANKCSNTA